MLLSYKFCPCCIATASIRSVIQQHSNSHFFSIPILLAFFSVKSANPTVFRKCILLPFFSAKSVNSTVFRIPILLLTEMFSAKPTVFRRLRRLQIPKRIRPKVARTLVSECSVLGNGKKLHQ